MLCNIVILGAGGDLAARYLMPSLVQIFEAPDLPDTIRITGVAREEWTNESFRDYIGERLDEFAPDVDRKSRERMLGCLNYHRADVTDADSLRPAFEGYEGPSLAYLALPPAIFPGAIKAIETIGLPQGSRIVVEKPFGEDLESAEKLNAMVHDVFPERSVFRIDHFLGKQTVQNILGLRFGNRIFEPLWNNYHIRQVEIVWDETLALEGRAGYYDSAGALKDMIQNHLLQLLSLIAMEPPTRLNEDEFRDRKLDVLRSIRRLDPTEVDVHTWRGRYTEGEIDGREIPNYVNEEGVEPENRTETFAEVRLTIDNWRWSGVPFVLRSGKALGKNRREINIHFHPVPHQMFEQTENPESNMLQLGLDPDRVSLDFNVNRPGDLLELRPVDLDVELAPPDLPAYATLILDAMGGDPMLFIRHDEAEEAWRIMEPILSGWEQEMAPLHEYPAGSDVDTGMTIRPGS